MPNNACIRVVIKGRVQGVGYRNWTSAKAEKMQLSGWVRNRADGTVEATFSGPENDVRAMISLCRKGPLLAKVDDIREAQTEIPAETGFRILPTS